MKKILYTASVLLLLITGCDRPLDIVSDAMTIYPIDLAGSWGISSVMQNDVDITDKFDFSTFDLTLDYSGTSPTTFTLADDNVPFACINAPDDYFTTGNWAFNDQTFATVIHLLNAASDTVTVAIEPLAPKDVSLTMEFRMDCSDNKYVYQLTKN